MNLRVIMKHILIALFLMSSSMNSYGQNDVINKLELQSYKEWKNSQIQNIKTKIRKIEKSGLAPKSMVTIVETEAGFDGGVETNEKLQSEKDCLEVAKNLSVADYFAGYLSKIPNKTVAYKKIAKKLSAEEIAEIMIAYTKAAFMPSDIDSINKVNETIVKTSSTLSSNKPETVATINKAINNQEQTSSETLKEVNGSRASQGDQ